MPECVGGYSKGLLFQLNRTLSTRNHTVAQNLYSHYVQRPKAS